MRADGLGPLIAPARKKTGFHGRDLHPTPILAGCPQPGNVQVITQRKGIVAEPGLHRGDEGIAPAIEQAAEERKLGISPPYSLTIPTDQPTEDQLLILSLMAGIIEVELPMQCFA